MEFSDIALAKFLQASPELGNLIVAFRDVSDELSEQSDTQVGIFVLRSGAEIYFVPVISKSDNVNPIDSIFVQSTGKFLPLTKKITEQVLNQQALSIGQTTKIPGTVVTNPSVYHLINPPRTGKYVYASSSRLTEFLATIPEHLKTFLRDRIGNDTDLATGLNRLFGLEPLMESLKPAAVSQGLSRPSDSLAIITDKEGLDVGDQTAQDILQRGYSVVGRRAASRMAINAEDFSRMGKITSLSNVDGNEDYAVIFRDGNVRHCYLPKVSGNGLQSPANAVHSTGQKNFCLFEDGTYAISDNILVVGEGSKDKQVLENLFTHETPLMVKDMVPGDTFAVFTPDMQLTGVFRLNSGLTYNSYGVSGRVVCRFSFKPLNLFAYRNFRETPLTSANDIFIPYNALAIRLGNDVSYDLEVNVNAAQSKRSLSELMALGSSLDLGYDGVEFAVNGRPVGDEPGVMRILVVREGIAPDAAESFVKQAKVQRRVKIYLSKKADFEPGEVPEFGDQPPQQQDTFGANLNDPMPSIRDAVQTNDAQIVESSIISELLQSPDMQSQISEYLPDIEEAVDKLGRVLFLSRVHLDQLAEANDADNVMAFLATLKNVYRNLGDTYIKLQQLTSNVVPAE